MNQAFFLNGTKLAPTSHVALIYAACPLVVLLLAEALGQERLVPGRLVGVLVSMLGVVVIGLDSLWHGGAAGQATLRGDLLLVGAVTSWGAYLTVSKPLIARHGPLPRWPGRSSSGRCSTRRSPWRPPGPALLAAVPASAWLARRT